MAYTKTKIEQAAQLLVKALPGLHIEVARAWVTAEQGDNNNVLGLTDANHKLYTFPTLAAGVQACANWILNPKSPYRGIRLSLNGGTIAQQGRAIIASLWNTPGSPYYTRIFTQMGLFKQVTPIPPKPTPPPPTPTPPGDTTLTLSTDPSIAEKQILASLGFGDVSDPTEVLRVATPEQVRELALLGYFGQPGAVAGVDYSLFKQYYKEGSVGVGSPSASKAAAEGRTILHNWEPINPNQAIWADYLTHKTTK